MDFAKKIKEKIIFCISQPCILSAMTQMFVDKCSFAVSENYSVDDANNKVFSGYKQGEYIEIFNILFEKQLGLSYFDVKITEFDNGDLHITKRPNLMISVPDLRVNFLAYATSSPKNNFVMRYNTNELSADVIDAKSRELNKSPMGVSPAKIILDYDGDKQYRVTTSNPNSTNTEITKNISDIISKTINQGLLMEEDTSFIVYQLMLKLQYSIAAVNCAYAKYNFRVKNVLDNLEKKSKKELIADRKALVKDYDLINNKYILHLNNAINIYEQITKDSDSFNKFLEEKGNGASQAFSDLLFDAQEICSKYLATNEALTDCSFVLAKKTEDDTFYFLNRQFKNVDEILTRRISQPDANVGMQINDVRKYINLNLKKSLFEEQK